MAKPWRHAQQLTPEEQAEQERKRGGVGNIPTEPPKGCSTLVILFILFLCKL